MSARDGSCWWLRVGLWCAGLVVAVGVTSDRTEAGQAAPATPSLVQGEQAPAQVPNVGGRWDLNWQESDKPPENVDGQEAGAGRPGGGGRPPGGGGGMGGIFGGVGRAGSGAGRSGGEGDRGRGDSLETVRQYLQAPRSLLIVEQPDSVTITDEHGEVLRLTVNGLKVRETRNGRTVERRASWNGRTLVVETSPGGRLKIVQTYKKVAEGLQLIVTTTVEGGPGGQPIELKRIYDQSLEAK